MANEYGEGTPPPPASPETLDEATALFHAIRDVLGDTGPVTERDHAEIARCAAEFEQTVRDQVAARRAEPEATP